MQNIYYFSISSPYHNLFSTGDTFPWSWDLPCSLCAWFSVKKNFVLGWLLSGCANWMCIEGAEVLQSLRVIYCWDQQLFHGSCATVFSPQEGSTAWNKHKLNINDSNMKYKVLSHGALHPLNPCFSPPVLTAFTSICGLHCPKNRHNGPFLWWLFLQVLSAESACGCLSLSLPLLILLLLKSIVHIPAENMLPGFSSCGKIWIKLVVLKIFFFFFFCTEANFAGDFPVPPPYSVATSLPTYDEAEKAKAAAMAASAVEVIPRVRGGGRRFFCFFHLVV